MTTQFFPFGDAEFDAWLNLFAANLGSVAASMGLPATFDDAIGVASADYSARLGAHVSAQAAARAARELKDESKRAAIEELRSVTAQLRAHPNFTDAFAAQLALRPYDRIKTRKKPQAEAPYIGVEPASPQVHRITIRRQLEGGALRRAKPEWARAARIVRAFEVPGADRLPDLSEMSFVGHATAGSLEVDFAAEHVGKTAWYRAAWETPRGELGPWSDPAKCTVTG